MDFKKLADNLGLEPDEFTDLAELFIQHAADDLDHLCAALRNKDTLQAIRFAHTLKGSAGNLGFTEMSELAEKAQEMAQNKSWDKLNGLFQGLKAHLERVKQALDTA